MFEELGELKTEIGVYFAKKRLPTEGSHGISYVATRESDGDNVFVKIPAIDSRFAQKQTDFQRRLKKLSAKFQTEAENGRHLENVKNIARVLDTGTFPYELHGSTVKVPFLIQDFVDGESLLDEMRLRRDGNGFVGVSSEKWLELAEGILTPLQGIHERGVVHGDLHMGNILIRKRDRAPVIVDFGESFLKQDKSHERRPGYGDHLRAPEKRGKKDSLAKAPWEAPSDVYSFGGLMYLLASGEDLPDSIGDHGDQPADLLRDRVEKRLERFNPQLLRDNPCILQILLLALKPNPHERATARQLLDYVRIIRLADKKAALDTNWKAEVELRSLANDAERNPSTHPLVNIFVRMNVERFGEKIRQLLRYGRFEMSGDRTEMLNHLQAFLAVLEAGDAYWSVTHPSFWQPSNLGVRGRFYDINLVLGRRGVRIRRLFVVSSKDESRSDEVELRSRVFRAHQQLALELEAYGIDVRAGSVLHPSGFYTGIVEKETRDDVRDVLASGYLVGFASIKNEPYSLTFRSEGVKSVVRRIAIQKIGGEEFKMVREKFESLQKASCNILDWCRSEPN